MRSQRSFAEHFKGLSSQINQTFDGRMLPALREQKKP